MSGLPVYRFRLSAPAPGGGTAEGKDFPHFLVVGPLLRGSEPPSEGRKRGSGLFFCLPCSEVNWGGLGGEREEWEGWEPWFPLVTEGLEAGANSTPVSSWGKVSWQQLDQPPGFLISPAPPVPSGLWHLIWMAKMNIGLGRWSRNPSFLPHLVPLQIFTQILSLWLKF